MSNKSQFFDNTLNNHYKINPLHTLNRREVASHEQDRHHKMLHQLRFLIPQAALKLSDAIGCRWLRKNISPYKNEIAAAADILGTGIYTLNTGFEWGCTTMVNLDETTGAPVMHRMLDWGLPIGKFMHVAEYQTVHGSYTDINWAGNSGMINAIAPGRFCIAINQAPIPMHSRLGVFGFPFDWAIQRIMTYRSRDWAPAHLLRHVFETAPDYQTAKAMLTNMPLAIPAIFTLCGVHPNEYCVIERMENAGYVMEGKAACTANHWQNPAWRGHARPIKSQARLSAAQNFVSAPGASWLKEPILNKHSILAFRSGTSGAAEIIILSVSGGKLQPYAICNISELTRFPPPGITKRAA